jgi:hypothetical protein
VTEVRRLNPGFKELADRLVPSGSSRAPTPLRAESESGMASAHRSTAVAASLTGVTASLHDFIGSGPGRSLLAFVEER